MINDNDSPRAPLDIDRVIAMAEAENQAEGTGRPTYADHVEIAYKAFEIGLWELGHGNFAGARPWLRSAVDFDVEDARPLLALCLASPTTEPTTSVDAPPVEDATPAIGDAPPEVGPVGAALAVFALEFGMRTANERLAARTWFPRRQLGIVRAATQLIILTRALTRTLDDALRLNLDRVHARVTKNRDLAHDRAEELISILKHARNQAFDLKLALDRDRDHASDFAFARTRADGLYRDLRHIHILAKEHDIAWDGRFDHDIAHVLGPHHHTALVNDLAKVRDDALTRARDRALDQAFPVKRARALLLDLARDRVLAPTVPLPDSAEILDRAVVRDVEGDGAVALHLAGALDHDQVSALDNDHEEFDRELITAVGDLEEALRPSTPRN